MKEKEDDKEEYKIQKKDPIIVSRFLGKKLKFVRQFLDNDLNSDDRKWKIGNYCWIC